MTIISVIYIRRYLADAALNPAPIWTHETRAGRSLLRISSDGKVIISYSGRESPDRPRFDKDVIEVRDLSTGDLIQEVYKGDETVHAIAVSPDGTMLAGRIGNVIQIWRFYHGVFKPSTTIRELVSAIEFSPDGTMLAGKERNNAYMWDAKSGEFIWQKRENVTYVIRSRRGERLFWEERQYNTDSQRWLHFSPDGKHLAVPVLFRIERGGFKTMIRLLDTHTGKLIASGGELGRIVFTGAYSHDGTVLAVAGCGPIELLAADGLRSELVIDWKLPPLVNPQRWEEHPEDWPIVVTNDISLSPNDEIIAIAAYSGASHIQLIDAHSGSMIRYWYVKTRDLRRKSPSAFAFSPSGNEIVVTNGGMLSLYRVDEHKKR